MHVLSDQLRKLGIVHEHSTLLVLEQGPLVLYARVIVDRFVSFLHLEGHKGG